MQPIQKKILNNATILSRNAFPFFKWQVSNSCQDQKHELEIDNKTPGLLFSLNSRLYKVEKAD